MVSQCPLADIVASADTADMQPLPTMPAAVHRMFCYVAKEVQFGVGDRRLKLHTQPLPNSPVNRILAALPKATYKRMMARMERVLLENKQLGYDVDKPIKFVYFPLTGV